MKLYLDMDGVIANFEKRYIELFNESPGSARDRKMFSKNWTKFIEGKHFETLEWWPGASELITFGFRIIKLRTEFRISIQIPLMHHLRGIARHGKALCCISCISESSRVSG